MEEERREHLQEERREHFLIPRLVPGSAVEAHWYQAQLAHIALVA